MQKFAATSKFIDNKTTTAFVQTHLWLVFERDYGKMKRVIYTLL